MLTSVTQVENLSLSGWKGPGGILNPTPRPPPQTAFWHTPRKKSELMAHQMLKGKISSPVIEGPAGHSCTGNCSQGLCITKMFLTKILLRSGDTEDNSGGEG